MSSLHCHEIPGRVSVFSGRGGLPALRVESDHGSAEVYLHGAHVTAFRRHGGEPLLFLSGASEFCADKPIRGGVPVIFPWFGPREGQPMHGTARLAEWELLETGAGADGSVRLRFRLPGAQSCEVTFTVTVGESLRMELGVTNHGGEPFTFEECLHTYFAVGDIHRVAVAGLHGARYRDQLQAAEFTEQAEVIRFTAETDRVYQDTAAALEIIDPALGRVIRIAKSGSRSTVVWNPWIDKARRMPDFGDDEYLRMLCVESGNVRDHAVTLEPGGRSLLRVELEARPLG